MSWTVEQIPSQENRVAIVTGANSGIGYEAAKALAAKGATVILACRNLGKANAAAELIRNEVKTAKLDVMMLDLADLESVKAFAAAFNKKYSRLDLLINNAGVMAPPLTKTKQGFEVQFGSNHLGHFALTGLLMDALKATAQSRVVNVSSNVHRNGKIDFANLNAEKSYGAWAAYGQSKLANLLFTLELNKRLKAAQVNAIATAAHPGWTHTGLQKGGFIQFLSGLIGQKPNMGALPTLNAAIAAQANDYIGPDGFQNMRGYPKKEIPSAAAQDAQVASQLWEVSEQMTGIRYL